MITRHGRSRSTVSSARVKFPPLAIGMTIAAAFMVRASSTMRRPVCPARTFSQWPETRRPPWTFASSRIDWAAASCSGIGASIEYLPFHSVPASFYVGYDYANISKAHDAKGGDSAAVYLGVKFHFGSGRSLRDFQRTGPVEWMGDSRPGANLKF